VRERAPIRVLHVVGSLNRGGVETWLLEVFRHIDRSQFAMDVLVHSAAPGALDDEARAVGVSIVPAAESSQPARFARRFLATLRTSPGYDVVHSHVHHFSAYPLELARLAGVPVRIAHSHSDTASVQRAASRVRRLYFASARQILGRVATHRLAASMPAGRALFGPEWPTRAGDRVLHYGFDFGRFQEDLDGAAVRRDLGIPPQAFVIGHVGRFHPVKNHPFLVEVMVEVARRVPDAVLLMVGDGPTRPQIEDLVTARGLSGRVVFAGPRSDVPEIMRAAMDALLVPSLYEGLSIVAIEAQAAGLPCLLSDTVPREVSVVPQRTRFLSLDAPASTWADAVLQTRTQGGGRRSGPEELMTSSFGIDSCLAALAEVYAPGSSPSRRRGATSPAATVITTSQQQHKRRTA